MGSRPRRIATDGIDIFVQYADAELLRAADGQRPIRDVIDRWLRYISWDAVDESPIRLQLRQYPETAPVVIDPRFGWGAPVVASNKVQVDAIVKLWRAGETLDAVAAEYGLTRDAAESICRIAA